MNTDTKVVIAGAVLVALGAWYAQKKLTGAAGAAGEWASRKAGAAGEWVSQNVAPWKDTNLAYQGANAVASAIAGRPETLGGWLHSVFSDDDKRVADMLVGKPAVYNSTGLSDAEAAKARSVFAQQDPRRLDMLPPEDLIDYRYF